MTSPLETNPWLMKNVTEMTLKEARLAAIHYQTKCNEYWCQIKALRKELKQQKTGS